MWLCCSTILFEVYEQHNSYIPEYSIISSLIVELCFLFEGSRWRWMLPGLCNPPLFPWQCVTPRSHYLWTCSPEGSHSLIYIAPKEEKKCQSFGTCFSINCFDTPNFNFVFDRKNLLWRNAYQLMSICSNSHLYCHMYIFNIWAVLAVTRNITYPLIALCLQFSQYFNSSRFISICILILRHQTCSYFYTGNFFIFYN